MKNMGNLEKRINKQRKQTSKKNIDKKLTNPGHKGEISWL